MSKGLEALQYFRTEIVDNYYAVECYEIIEKELKLLQQHKQIEEELGIDLITLFKALKNGVWVKNNEQGIHFISLINWNCEVSRINDKLVPLFTFNVWNGNEEDKDETIYFVKDYGKTWALTKEELL